MSKGGLSPNVFVKIVSANIYKDYEVKGKMDPFVKVTLGKQSFQTSTATNQGQHPQWADTQFVFFRTNEDKVICELWEDDVDTSDDYLGTAEIIIADVLKKKQSQTEQTFIVYNKKEKIADLNVIITVDDTKKIDAKKSQKELNEAEEHSKMASEIVEDERKKAKDQKKSNQQNNSSPHQLKPNITVQIVGAKIYKNYESSGKMDPYFIMRMGDQQYQTTTATNQGQEPKWTTGAKQGFYRYDEQEIELELWEDDEYKSDDYLGTAKIDIEELLSNQPKENKYLIYDQKKQEIGEVQLMIQVDLSQVVDKEEHDEIIQEAKRKADEESNKNQEARKAKISQNQNKSQIDPKNDPKSKIKGNSSGVQSKDLEKSNNNKPLSKDDLNKKTKEIQDRISNVQVRLKPNPVVPYIEDNVHRALLEGMKKLAKERPLNPIRELGMFLVNYQGDSGNQQQ